MIEINLLHDEIKKGIENYFSFLKDFHFSDFIEIDFGLNYHFESINNDSNIEIRVERLSFAPISVNINGYRIAFLEPDNNFEKNYVKKAEEYYIDYEEYLERNKNKETDEFRKRYRTLLTELNNQYFEEVAFILKRNKKVFSGDNSLLKVNRALAIEEAIVSWKENDITRKIKDEIYSCDFKFGSGIEGSYEAQSIEEIRKYLKDLEDDSIRDIDVYDWNKEKIKFSLD